MNDIPPYINIIQSPETWARLLAHVHQEALALFLCCNGIVNEALSELVIDSLRRGAVMISFRVSLLYTKSTVEYWCRGSQGWCIRTNVL